jgi:hypothetical protein
MSSFEVLFNDAMDGTGTVIDAPLIAPDLQADLQLQSVEESKRLELSRLQGRIPVDLVNVSIDEFLAHMA